MSEADAGGDAASENPEGGETDRGAANPTRLPLNGGMGRAVRAGLSGEAISAHGVLEAIGGWRGIAETLTPGLLFLVVYSFTKDEKLAIVPPAVLALIAIAIRLVRKESIISAISGAIGVGIAIAATLVTGKGEGYYIPGFWTNGAWILGLLVSILVRWPLIGFVMGALRGDLLSWRKDRVLSRVALWLTTVWLGMFVARLAVQLPLFYSEQVEALGVARLVMGVPLFALVVIFTWMVLSRLRESSDVSIDETTEDASDSPPSP